MAITFREDGRIFHLTTKNTSYLIQIVEEGYVAHVYWGKKLKLFDLSNQFEFRDRGFSPCPKFGRREFSLDTLPQEYPQYGNGDFRDCAYQIEDENGSRISDLRYKTHRIYTGKSALKGLPYVYENKPNEVMTLEITMYDSVLQLDVILIYNVFDDKDAITRSVKFINHSEEKVQLLRALSMNIDIRRDDLDIVNLYGSHNNERNLERRKLGHDKCVIESTRGASSPHQSCFIALLDQDANENHGEVFALQFVYSGNFRFSISSDVLHCTRVKGGINPFEFSWCLEGKAEFQTPEVVMIYSDRGLNPMSSLFHELYRDNLCRGRHKYEARPVLINNWEATYFDFNESLLLDLAQVSAKAGIELFVLDDGWFKNRNSDTTSLGDWICDEKKIPHGLRYLSQEINKMGMQFGLWLEPEMVNVDSDLYRAHPDYCIHAIGRDHTFSRDQLVLDLGKEVVREYLFMSLCRVLDSADIAYIKWDMNRHMCDCYSDLLPFDRQKEMMHRYMLGLYELMEKLITRYPDILFESCSSGGGRFDPGMLYYMPQTWTSDNTDAICRSMIQYTTSFTFPLITMGSHVSKCPNEQIGRNTPLSTRFHIATMGNLGYELNLLDLNEKELHIITEQIIFYKQIRNTMQFGTLYRLRNPFDTNTMAMNVVSQDEKEVIIVYLKKLSMASADYDILKLKGLNNDALYIDVDTGSRYYGSQLMNAGISVAYVPQDFYSKMIHLRMAQS